MPGGRRLGLARSHRMLPRALKHSKRTAHRVAHAQTPWLRKFGGEVREFLKASGIKAVRPSVRSPWQNGVAERWVGTCRREMLDHVIPLNDRHLLRLGHEYIRYYHEDRTHIGLHKETPAGRLVESRPSPSSKVWALPRIGGLHRRYTWSAAA